jgi:hypothetical protein
MLQKILNCHVRYGPLADIPAGPPDVRFTLKRDTARHCCYVQFVSRRHSGGCWI